MIIAFLKLLSEYGAAVGVLLAVILFLGIMVFFILKWTMKQYEKLSDRSDKREDKLMGIIEGQRTTMETNSTNVRNLHEEMKVANAFNRQEHEKIIANADTSHTRIVGLLNNLISITGK